mgnify:CR=1 FL=1
MVDGEADPVSERKFSIDPSSLKLSFKSSLLFILWMLLTCGVDVFVCGVVCNDFWHVFQFITNFWPFFVTEFFDVY